MPTEGLGLLLSLPLDSIAVRTFLASVVAVVLGRLLLQRGLVRLPRLRAAVALLPGVALAVVLVAFATSPALPGLWLPVDAARGLAVRVSDTYLNFAPVAASTLLIFWASIVALRLWARGLRNRSVTRTAYASVAAAVPTPAVVGATVRRIAASMSVAPPEVAIVPRLAGGAMVLGVHQPLLVIDARLLSQLDEAELEGVVAHELAHVRRRDNLVAAVLGVVRDAFFFVPGGAWSLNRLLKEREHAADTAAVAMTGRPGALASGLLKVLEGSQEPVACAPLMPEGSLVERVQVLCDERPPPSRLRTAAEVGLTLSAVVLAVATAVHLPGVLSGDERQRDALGVLLSDVAPSAASPGTTTATAFRVYGATAAERSTARAAAPSDVEPELDDPRQWTLQSLAACDRETVPCTSPGKRRTLSLRPPRVVSVDDDRIARWHLDPVVASDSREVALFWFQQVE